MNFNRLLCTNFFKIISRQSSSETIVNFNPKIELNNKTQIVESHQKNDVRQLFLIICLFQLKIRNSSSYTLSIPLTSCFLF